MTFRYINTATWNDPWFEGISSESKLLFIYLFTNDHTNQAGIMQLSARRISYDTGLSQDKVSLCLDEIGAKVVCRDSWLWVKNFFRYQRMNDSFTASAISAASKTPFFSEWCEHNSIDPENFKKKEPKKKITEQSRAEQEVSPRCDHRADTVSSPVSIFSKTTNDIPADFGNLSKALGKPQVSQQELVIWQELKSLNPPCQLQDVESARIKKAKNNLSYLQNIVCECRDERIKIASDPNRPKTNRELIEEFEAMAKR